MNLGLTGVCNGTDLTSTFTPTPHHEESWGTGKPGVKIGPGASRGQPARSLGASLSLSPLFIGPRSQGFSSSLFAIGRGLAFFPPLSLSLPPPSLSLAPRTGAHRLPPAPREGRNLEKKVSQKFGSEQGREDQERKREREERKGEGGGRENKKMMKSSLHRL